MDWKRRLALPAHLWQDGQTPPEQVYEKEAPEGTLFLAASGSGAQGDPFQLIVFFEPPRGPEDAPPPESRFPTPEDCMDAADFVFPTGTLMQSVDGVRVVDSGTRDAPKGPCMCGFIQVGVEQGTPAANRNLIITPDSGGPRGRPTN